MEGDAQKWFATLPVGSIRNFNDLMEKFRAQFRYRTERIPTITDLSQVVQKADESFEDYVNRWRSVASKMSFAIPESEAVEMVIEHMTGPLKTAVAYGNPTTFVKLFDRVARMERRTKDGTIPLSSSSQPSSKPPSSYQARKKTTKAAATPNAATMEEESQMGAVEVRLPDQKQSGRNLSQKTPSNDRRPPQTDDRRRLHQDARVPYDYGGGKKGATVRPDRIIIPK